MKCKEKSEEALHKVFEEAASNIDETNFKTALKLINNGLKQFSGCYELAIMKAEVLMLLQKYEQAKKLLDKLKESEPEDPYVYFHLAHYSAAKEKNLEKATKLLKKGLTYDPENFDLLSAVANYLKLTNNPEYSDYLKKAFAVDKVRAQQFVENYWIESLDVLWPNKKKAEKQIIVDVEQTMRKVFQAFKEEDFDTALNGIKAMKSKGYVDKRTMDLLFLLEIDSYLGKRQPEKAMETATYVTEMWPRNPVGHSALAKVELANGNLEKALEHIDEAIMLGEKHGLLQPHMLVTKGEVLQAMGKSDFGMFFERADSMIKKDMAKLKDNKEFRQMSEE